MDIDPLRDGTPPRPASTVVLLRDGAHGLEVFLVRRARGTAFMGGAYVFPGGKLDPGDSDPDLLGRLEGAGDAAERLGEPGLEPEVARGLFVAAVRETLEEAGVLLTDRAVDAAAARAALAVPGASFVDVARAQDVRLDAQALVPFARWVTPAVESRRFDARFFLAAVPAGAVGTHDEGETVASTWKRPDDAIADHLAARIDLPPPTLRTLEELRTIGKVSEALEAARARRPPLVRPVLRDLSGTWILALPGDSEHPEAGPVVPGPTRFTLRDGRFVSG